MHFQLSQAGFLCIGYQWSSTVSKTKGGCQAAAKPKEHTRFGNYLLRNISTAIARFRAYVAGEFSRFARFGRLSSN